MTDPKAGFRELFFLTFFMNLGVISIANLFGAKVSPFMLFFIAIVNGVVAGAFTNKLLREVARRVQALKDGHAMQMRTRNADTQKDTP